MGVELWDNLNSANCVILREKEKRKEGKEKKKKNIGTTKKKRELSCNGRHQWECPHPRLGRTLDRSTIFPSFFLFEAEPHAAQAALKVGIAKDDL